MISHEFPLLMELNMENKVVYEVRLSKPVLAIATIAAIGLLAIGAKPFIEASPAFASNEIHKIAICDFDHGGCTKVSKTSKLLQINSR